MKTYRKQKTALRATIAAAALFGTVVAASAGGQSHVLPADYGKTYPTYQFKIVSMPPAGTTLTVQLVNTETGQLVTNAHVTMQHTVSLGIKAVPQVQRILLPLEPDGRGDYVCSHGPLPSGDPIVLRAHVPGESSATWLTVAPNN